MELSISSLSRDTAKSLSTMFPNIWGQETAIGLQHCWGTCSGKRQRLCGGTSRASVPPGRVGSPRAQGQACRSSSHIFTSKSWLIPHPCPEQGSRRRQDLAHGHLQPPRHRNYFPPSAEERNQAFLRDVDESSTSPCTLCTDPRGSFLYLGSKEGRVLT